MDWVGEFAPVQSVRPAIRGCASTISGGPVQPGIRALGPCLSVGNPFHPHCCGLCARVYLDVSPRLLGTPDLQHAVALHLRRQRGGLPRALSLYRAVPGKWRGGHSGSYPIQSVFHRANGGRQRSHCGGDGRIFSAVSPLASAHHRAIFFRVVHVAAGMDRARLLLRRTIPARVMGAYFLLYPRSRVLTIVPFFFVWFMWLPAWIVLGYFFVGQFLLG